MNYEKICKLIDGIIESEFNHIQEFKESKFIDTDTTQQELHKTSIELIKKLTETLSKEQIEILLDLEAAICNEWTNLCRFYLREGVRAGLTNLKYLNEIDHIGSYI